MPFFLPMPPTTITSPTAPPTGITVRPDLMARLGTATRLNALATTPPLCTLHSALSTPRLTLRPLTLADRPDYLRIIRTSRRHLEEFCPLSNPSKDGGSTNESPEDIFERHLALAHLAQQTGRAWRTIALDHDNRIVGAFNINDITRGLENSGELVFWLAADSLRRGYAEEAVHAAINHAFNDLPTGLGLHRLIALIAPNNDACVRLARKVGLSLALGAPPAPLKLGDRTVQHNVFQIYAGIELPPPTDHDGRGDSSNGGLVEGKPSIADAVFGRGLLSILRTEGLPPNTAA
jgi:RimJ/RimL family protein N-acetyltransferase